MLLLESSLDWLLMIVLTICANYSTIIFKLSTRKAIWEARLTHLARVLLLGS